MMVMLAVRVCNQKWNFIAIFRKFTVWDTVFEVRWNDFFQNVNLVVWFTSSTFKTTEVKRKLWITQAILSRTRCLFSIACLPAAVVNTLQINQDPEHISPILPTSTLQRYQLPMKRVVFDNTMKKKSLTSMLDYYFIETFPDFSNTRIKKRKS